MTVCSPPARRARAIAIAALVAAAGALHAPTQAQSSPRVVAGPGGATQVIFRNGCTVTFDVRGREAGRTGNCSAEHRDRARDAYEAYRRDQGWHGGPGWWGTPTVTMQPSGLGQVRFRDGCTVDYNRQGQRRDASRDCRNEQLRRADDAMADYRREHGWDDVGSGGWWGVPEITVDRNGAGQARFRNGCVVDYNRRGERRDSSRECRDEQLRRADLAMAEYRREHGFGGGGGWNPPGKGRIRALPGGGSEVSMGSNCTVRYDAEGVRQSVAPACTPGQLRDANELEVRWRLQRLNQQGQGG